MTEIITNAKDVSKNLSEATANISKVVSLFERGEGLAGGLFKDDEMKTDFAKMVNRLSTLVSNLNENGILWKGERSKRNPPNVFRGGKKRKEELQGKPSANK